MGHKQSQLSQYRNRITYSLKGTVHIVYTVVFLVTIERVVKTQILIFVGDVHLLLGLFILKCKTGGTFIYVWRTPGLWILFRRCFLL